jgi:nitrogen-specific signal transduction histidine kinase
MRLLINPVIVRMGLLLFASLAAFGLGLFAIRKLRTSIVADPESLEHTAMGAEGLPVHAYHAVIQQLKQQKHELAAQQLADRRKAKASDTLSTTILSSLSCGVLFLNTSGLVRQANSAARQLLGFASPIGLHASDLFRSATLRPEDNSDRAAGAVASFTVEQALAPALAGKSAVNALTLNYFTREGASLVLEVTASPVLAEDASLMGTTIVLTDKTDLERIRHDQREHQEISAEMAHGLRDSLATISGYAQQLARSRDPEFGRQLADNIAHEAAQLDRTIGSFLGGARAAATNF